MTPVLELIRTTQVVGLRRMLRLRRAQRLVWPEMMNGFYSTRIMQTLLNVGFFDELKAHGRVDVAAFAKAQRLDPAILRSLCDALYSLQILDKEGDQYRLTPRGDLLVNVGRGWFDGVYGYEGVFHQLEGLLRGEHQYGKDIYRRSYYVAKGSGEIEDWLYFPLAADFIRRGGYTCVLDLGCGEGTFLRRICETIPGVDGRGIDLAPEAIADGRRKLDAAGLSRRIDLFVGDMVKLEALPPSFRAVDAATVFFVLHEILYAGEARVIEFLRAFRRLFPGVPLMVFEVNRPSASEMRRRPGMAIPYFLQHDLSNQRPVTKEAWIPLFEAAGFERITTRDLAFARSVIFTLE
jgi:phenylpyruvate C(3)-methyltransferase